MRKKTFLMICVAGALAASVAPPAGAQYTDYRQAAGDQYGQRSARAKACVSNRRFTVTVRGPHGRPAVHVRVTLNGRALRVVRRHGRLQVLVDLRGRRAGVANLRISGVEYSAHRYAKAKKRFARTRSAPAAPQRRSSRPRRSTRGGPFRLTRRFQVCAKAAAGARTVVVAGGRPASATATPGGTLPGGSVVAVLGLSLLGAGSLAAAGRRVGRRRANAARSGEGGRARRPSG
jgi:hypothetical protein